MANSLPIVWFRLNWTNSGSMAWEFAAPLPHTNSAPPTRTMTYDADNRLSQFQGPTMGALQSVGLDAVGNLTNAPLTNDTFAAHVYDARNRLLTAGGVTNAYDAANNRIGQISGTNTTVFVVNPNAKLPQVLMRIKNGVTTYYVYGAGLLYQVTETATVTNTLTYHYDYRGSTVAMTDGNGNVTDRIEYSLYGLTTYRAGTTDTPFLFNGRYGVMTDPNGLLYMRARYYNPYLCRFISSDPSGFAGGLNWYCYAGGNPISYLDPFGLGAVGENGGTSWISQMDLYGTMSDLATAGFNNGGIMGSVQGNFYSGATALLDTLGGQAVGTTATLSGTDAGNGNTLGAIGWGTTSVGLIALNAYTGGQSAAAVSKLGMYAADPILYEIGSKTLPTTVYQDLGLAGMSQIAKGAAITEALYGGSKAAAFFTPVATTAYGTTITTGLTPGAAYLLNWGTQGANASVNGVASWFQPTP